MNRNRTVAGFDVHKDSIYLCIMGHGEAIIFEKTYGELVTFHPPASSVAGEMSRKGCRSEQVAALQCRFNLIPDGIFGPFTDEAVSDFPKEHSLVEEGIVG